MTIPRLVRSGLLTTPLKLAVLAAVLLPGCGADTGPPPDETAKNNPPSPAKEPVVKAQGRGGTLKVMDIKKRS
jgi:hypothetical protein